MAALAADTGGLDGRKLSMAALALCLNVGMIGLLSVANLGERAQRSGAWTPPVYLDIEPRLLLPTPQRRRYRRRRTRRCRRRLPGRGR